MNILYKFLFLLFLLQFNIVWTQTRHDRNPVPYYTNSGLVYYYFWEEDALSQIVPKTYKTPFSCNSVVLLKDTFQTSKANQDNLQLAIWNLGRINSSDEVTIEKLKLAGQKIRFTKQGSTGPKVVLYIKKNGVWTSQLSGRILYFNRIESGPKYFDHSEENKIFYKLNSGGKLAERTSNFNTYSVTHYFANKTDLINGTVHYDQIKTFKSQDITFDLQDEYVFQPKHYLLFINGYRGQDFDKDPSKNEVYMNDRTNYWFHLDNRFKQRIQPDTSFYLDGSFPSKTSNHKTKIKFGKSLFKCYVLASSKHFKHNYNWLNTEPNVCGFDWRKENGKIAGNVFLNTLKNHPNSVAKDTLDIVCHSMGYAYTLGFLEIVSPYVYLRSCYIMAPENAVSGTFDWTKFEHVWQYGSNLSSEAPDLLCEQDGIAPQLSVPGIDDLPKPVGGRIYIPNKWPNKSFVHSHMIYSFDWMFDWIGKGERGYIEP